MTDKETEREMLEKCVEQFELIWALLHEREIVRSSPGEADEVLPSWVAAANEADIAAIKIREFLGTAQ